MYLDEHEHDDDDDDDESRNLHYHTNGVFNHDEQKQITIENFICMSIESLIMMNAKFLMNLELFITTITKFVHDDDLYTC